MKKFKVIVRTDLICEYEFEANSLEEAKELAETDIEAGDFVEEVKNHWFNACGLAVDILDVEEIKEAEND